MNITEVMTRIKFKLGIMNLASPIRNLDGTIVSIIKDITLPDFSLYYPDKQVIKLNLKDLEKIQDTNSYQEYLLPEFKAKKLLYVFNVYYDDSTLSGFGHYGGALPFVGGEIMQQVLASNAAANLYSLMMPKMTFEYIHPRRIKIYNQYSESALVFELGFQHDVSLASIPVATISDDAPSIATTDGSLRTIPLPFNVIRILAVPKSIPMSFELKSNNFIFKFPSRKYTFIFITTYYYMVY